jgi:hypothetical protein
VLTHATILPPNCTGLEEEGVLINNIKLVSRGRFLEAETKALLSSSQYLARTICIWETCSSLKRRAAAMANPLRGIRSGRPDPCGVSRHNVRMMLERMTRAQALRNMQWSCTGIQTDRVAAADAQ